MEEKGHGKPDLRSMPFFRWRKVRPGEKGFSLCKQIRDIGPFVLFLFDIKTFTSTAIEKGGLSDDRDLSDLADIGAALHSKLSTV